MQDSHVLGILTAGPVGDVPPVTICEQFNDLRADENANCVYTYAFVNMDASTMRAKVDNAQEIVRIIKDQAFEKAYKEKMSHTGNARSSGFALPDDFTMEDLIVFN